MKMHLGLIKKRGFFLSKRFFLSRMRAALQEHWVNLLHNDVSKHDGSRWKTQGRLSSRHGSKVKALEIT